MPKQPDRELFRTFSWDWYCTLTVYGTRSAERAEGLFNRWIRELEAAEAGPRFRWIRTLETDQNYGHTTVRVLVGGLRNRASYWRRQFKFYGGSDCIIESHDGQGRKLVRAAEEADDQCGPNVRFKLPADEA